MKLFIHNKTFKFFCDVCQKTFVKKSNLSAYTKNLLMACSQKKLLNVTKIIEIRKNMVIFLKMIWKKTWNSYMLSWSSKSAITLLHIIDCISDKEYRSPILCFKTLQNAATLPENEQTNILRLSNSPFHLNFHKVNDENNFSNYCLWNFTNFEYS